MKHVSFVTSSSSSRTRVSRRASHPVPLEKITAVLDKELKVAEIPDYSNALNGLQLANASGRVRRVACAVDACEAVIRQAVEAEADLLLVHHGLFWNGLQRLQGPAFTKLHAAIEGGLAIYSAHLPLDVHPTLGNNAQLARALRLTRPKPFFSWKGLLLGLRATVSLDRASLVKKTQAAVGDYPVHLCPGGPSRVRHVGIITGGAGSEVAAIAAEGIDTFITGEGPHWSYTLAEELGLNVLYAGHYATETFGVRALAAWLERKFGLPYVWIDHPTGL